MSNDSASPTTPSPTENKRDVFIQKYTQKTTLLLSALALVYLFTFSIQAIWPDKNAEWYQWMSLFSALLWALFAIDLFFRFFVTTNKRHFFRRNWLDTLTVMVPQLRALRTLTAFTKNGILSKGKGFFSGGAVATALVGSLIVIWVGSLSVLNAERDAQGADIETLPESLWWMFETITTVGYGDFVPVTWLGRSIAVVIMLLGISLLGVVTAGLSATLVKQNKPDPATEVIQELNELKSMVADLQKQLNEGKTSPST
jgi:voltage-gated potassium channel